MYRRGHKLQPLPAAGAGLLTAVRITALVRADGRTCSEVVGVVVVQLPHLPETEGGGERRQTAGGQSSGSR